MEKTFNCWSLYRHTSPSGKVYIGITSKVPEIRWGRNGCRYQECKVFFAAILKYGWNNITHEILFTGLDELTAKSLEIELIRHYKNLGISYNMTNGGDGKLGYVPSEDTRRKISESNIGKHSGKKLGPVKEETRRKLSEIMKGRYVGENNPNFGNHKLAGTNHPFFGKKHKPESLEKIRNSKLGKPNPAAKETVKIMQESNKIPVIGVSLETGQYAAFASAIDAAKYFGKGKSAASHITECCKGKRKQALGYTWKYNKDGDNNNYT